MDEHVLKGNSAILKCHIPSFVSDFVFIDAWIDDETNEEYRANMGEALGTESFTKFSLLVIHLKVWFATFLIYLIFISFIIFIPNYLSILSILINLSRSLTAYLSSQISFFT